MNTIITTFTPVISGERKAPKSLPDTGFILACHTAGDVRGVTSPAPVTCQGVKVGSITAVSATDGMTLLTGLLGSRDLKAFRMLRTRRIHSAGIELEDGIIQGLDLIAPKGRTLSVKDTESSIDATLRARRILAAYRNDTL